MTTASVPNPISPVRLVDPQSAERLDEVAHAKVSTHRWKRSYRTRVFLTDAIMIVLALAIAQIGRFGFPDVNNYQDSHWVARTIYSVALALTWLIALGILQTWDLSLVGTGSEEYRRVVVATGWVCGVIAATALAFQLYPYIARGYLLIALPVGLLGLLCGPSSAPRESGKEKACGRIHQ